MRMNECISRRFILTSVIVHMILVQSTLGFAVNVKSRKSLPLLAHSKNHDVTELTAKPLLQRSTFLSASLGAFALTFPTRPTFAEDATPKVVRSIEACPKTIQGNPNNCLGTSNIKQMDTYSPPWTFEVSPEEAFTRIKLLMASDPIYTVTYFDEDSLYLKANVQRNALIQDTIEFLVKGDEKVVLYKSSEKSGTSTVSDFGVNRTRMEVLRKNGGIFEIMGSQIGSADSFEGGAGGEENGLFGQLKLFFGYQSGEGFEEVLAE